jgi:hypothetical protein
MDFTMIRIYLAFCSLKAPRLCLVDKLWAQYCEGFGEPSSRNLVRLDIPWPVESESTADVDSHPE